MENATENQEIIPEQTAYTNSADTDAGEVDAELTVPEDTDNTTLSVGENYEIPEDVFPPSERDEFSTVFSTENDADADDIPRTDDENYDSNQIEYDIFNTETETDSFVEEYPDEQPPEQKKKKAGYDPENPRRIDFIFDLAELIVFSLVAALVLTTFFFRHSIVDGSSMENTLYNGEHLIISDLFYTPQRGDIIVCEDYSTNLRKPLVKRIIAVAGDRVQINPLGEVFINGELINEDYVYESEKVIYMPLDIVVPEGELFVMGDHRNVSYDSRQLGTIDEDSVLGKVLFRFYPFNKFGTV